MFLFISKQCIGQHYPVETKCCIIKTVVLHKRREKNFIVHYQAKIWIFDSGHIFTACQNVMINVPIKYSKMTKNYKVNIQIYLFSCKVCILEGDKFSHMFFLIVSSVHSPAKGRAWSQQGLNSVTNVENWASKYLETLYLCQADATWSRKQWYCISTVDCKRVYF